MNEKDRKMGEVRVEFTGVRLRVISMTPKAFIEMMRVLTTTFGTAGLTMFFHMGREKGIHDSSEVIEALRREGAYTKRRLLEAVMDRSRVLGWGASRLVKYDEGRGTVTIRIENNPIAKYCNAPGEPICYFLRGYWTGVVSEALEQELACEEARCTDRKNLCCEFIIGRGRRR